MLIFILGMTLKINAQKRALLNENQTLKFLIELKNEVITENRKTIDYLTLKIDTLETVITSLVIVNNITATMYHPTVEQCDSDPNITADGSVINIPQASKHRWIAVSQDLLHFNGGPFRYGDDVVLISKIKGKSKILGKYSVRDTMNKKWKKKIDILETPGTDIYKLSNITMIKI